MEVTKLFKPVESFDGEGFDVFRSKHKEGEFILLDVRQPGEYEKEHIPGATLIPMPSLSDKMSELDPEKPIVVY